MLTQSWGNFSSKITRLPTRCNKGTQLVSRNKPVADSLGAVGPRLDLVAPLAFQGYGDLRGVPRPHMAIFGKWPATDVVLFMG